ncbi:hypothetical protein L7F22_044199 [Adiantum nelumboides]|nr:hypothetical protein [Adiantum nelumboides]
MGKNLEQCMRSLAGTSREDHELHLLERINLDFTLHNSILPKAPNLTKFKMTGHLPILRVNFSDRKYKVLMAIIDVAIPDLDDKASIPKSEANGKITEIEQAQEPPSALANANERASKRRSRSLQASSSSTALDLNRERRSRIASQMRGGDEYLVDSAVDEDDDENEFEDAEDATADRINAHQKTFELQFVVDALQGSIYKSNTDPSKPDRLLVEASFEGFELGVAVYPYHLEVDVGLRSLDIEDKIVQQKGDVFKHIITSKTVDDGATKGGTGDSVHLTKNDKDLVRVKYTRVQTDSPEFMTVYEGIDQSINVELSTINLMLTRVSILALYDWIMTTFVPQDPATPPANGESGKQIEGNGEQQVTSPSTDGRKEKLRVRVKLTSIVLRLNNDGELLATLTLSTADVAVLLRGNTLRVASRIGSLSLFDNTQREAASPEFKNLLSIEGDELADFTYETFDEADGQTYPGYDMAVWLRTGSLRFVFVEETMADLLRFFSKFAQMKAVYDAATLAASEIYAHNTFLADQNDPSRALIKIEAGIRHIRLASRFIQKRKAHHVQMIDDVNIEVDITQQDGLTKEAPAESQDNANASTPQEPDMQILAKMSDVSINLTEQQYQFIMSLTQSIPKAFAATDEDELDDGTTGRDAEGATVSLSTSIDLLFSVNAINVELFSSAAIDQETMHKASLARLALTGSEVKLKMLSDSSLEAEVALKAFNVTDTRIDKQTQFRDIIPAIAHEGHQFMLSYSMGSDGSALALITVDSPKIIFSLDPLFALVDFFMSAFNEQQAEPEQPSRAMSRKQLESAHQSRRSNKGRQAPKAQKEASESSATMVFRINVVDPTIILLAEPERSDTKAIILSIRQVLMSQQGIVALKVDQFGMFMCRMNRPKDTVRLVDNFDIAMSLDSRDAGGPLQQTNTSIEVNIDPIILRVSLKDMVMISNVINRAIELSSKTGSGSTSKDVSKGAPSHISSAGGALQTIRAGDESDVVTPTKTAGLSEDRHRLEAAELLVTKEVLKADLQGIQLILIGDVHSLPLLDCSIAAFSVDVRDWSSDMRAALSIGMHVNYYNLKKSHWEPLIDPWHLDFSMESKAGSNSMTLSSKRTMELNVTNTLIEQVMTNLSVIQENVRDGEDNPDRDNQAPFLIRNRTGYRISLWGQHQGDAKGPRHGAQHLDDGHDLPWRFESWKVMRDHILDRTGGGNELSVHIEGMAWERIRHLNVDQQGEKIVNLRPKIDRVAHRLLCDVSLENNVKVAPGSSCPVPIEAAFHSRIRMRPDPGFEYGWSNEAVGWQDLIKKSTRVLTCNDSNEQEAPFRFQSFTKYDRNDPLARQYPRLTLRVRAPVEVENLLPYDIQYRIFDKNHNRNWSSFLRKGGVSPIHVVDLSHLLLLSIDVQSSVFSPSEFAIISTDNGDDFPVEKFLTLADSENLKLQLRLHYHKYGDSGGAFKVQIYSPYIFVNLTGLPFSLKTKSWIGGAKLVAGQDPVGSETELTIPSNSRNEEIHLGLTIEEGLGKFKLSKVVKLTPRYLVRNNLGEEVNLREVGAADVVTAQTGGRQPLHFLRVGASKQMCLAYPGLNNKWTSPFNLEDIGRVHLRIARAGHQQHLIKVDVLLEGPTIFISLEHEKGPWPFMLRNESDYTITFMQAIERGDAKQDGGADEAVGKRYELKPRSKMKYAWDYPAMPDKTVKLVANGRERNVNILEIGSLLPFKFPSGDGRGNRIVSLDVRADGPTQTLVISNWSEANSNYKMKRQNSTLSRSDTMRTDAGFEAVDVDTKIISSFNVELEGLGISLINRSQQELAYVSFRGFEFHYSESEVTTALNVICKWIQIDNQLFSGLFPIVLYPSVIAPNKTDLESHPTLQASLIRSKDESHGLVHIKYASFLLQEVTVELDEDFLFACLDFAKIEGISGKIKDDSESDFAEHPREVPDPKQLTGDGPAGNKEGEGDVYIGILHLQPLAINLSIVRSERSGSDETDDTSSGNPLYFLLNAASMAVGSLADAPIRLSALVIENVRLSPAVLDRKGHDALYSSHALPIVQIDSASKVTGSISQGLAAATMDREFQARRRLAKFRNKPRHALYGLQAAGTSFFTGITSGVEGLALRPLEGAEQNGAAGFVTGIGKALVGFATKPAVGIFDAASNLTTGVKNSLSLFDGEIDRVRLPRFIAADGIVRPYSSREAWDKCGYVHAMKED